MSRAQVVAVRLDEGRERPEDRRGVPVHVSQRVQGSLLAGRPGALARAQRAARIRAGSGGYTGDEAGRGRGAGSAGS
jgi:hypothetical protein